MDWITLFQLAGGLALLIAGGEALVRGSSRLAADLGVPSIVVGLTVVAFGTSAPELVVSVTSAPDGRGDIAFGNVVGSNTFNILLILGVSALITPLAVAQKLVRVDVPVMIGCAALAWLFSLDGRVSRFEGSTLAAGLVAYAVLCIRSARRESAAVRTEYEQEFKPQSRSKRGANLVAIVVGLALLVLGSRWFVAGAVDLARWFGLSELVIGLTIVAAGTSLPEVATSILAALRGERDIAVGNVVGSNVFNVLGVLGISSAITSGGIPASPAALAFDLPVMIAASIACLPIFFTGHTIARWEGWVFCGYYAAYVTFLILDAQQHDALPRFSSIMWTFVIPLTVLTICISVWRSLRARPMRDAAPTIHP